MAWASCGTAPFHVGRRVLAAVVHAGRQPVRGFPGPRSEMHPRASADSRSNSCFAAIRSHVRQGPVPNGTVSYQPSLAMTFRVMAALGAATHVFGGESSKDVGDRAKPAKPPAKPGHETEADRLADMGQHQRRFVSQETKRDGRETDCGRVSFVAAESRVIPNETAVRHQDSSARLGLLRPRCHGKRPASNAEGVAHGVSAAFAGGVCKIPAPEAHAPESLEADQGVAAAVADRALGISAPEAHAPEGFEAGPVNPAVPPGGANQYPASVGRSASQLRRILHPHAGMEMRIHPPRGLPADPRRRLQVGQPRHLHPARRAEMVQQRPLARRADALRSRPVRSPGSPSTGRRGAW